MFQTGKGFRFRNRKEVRKYFHIRSEIMNFYGKRCMRCKSTKQIELDHIIPVYKNKKLLFRHDNMQILCKKCNTLKGHYHKWDYRDEDDLISIREFMIEKDLLFNFEDIIEGTKERIINVFKRPNQKTIIKICKNGDRKEITTKKNNL